jgi:CheY-like chemotaxis protein
VTETRDQPRKILLIAEDDDELRELLKETLQPLCDEIYTTSNGEEALTLVRTRPEISAVVSDINMPKKTGLAVLASLRSESNRIPFILLTGFTNTQNQEEAARFEATSFLAKPYIGKELFTAVTGALSTRTEKK